MHHLLAGKMLQSRKTCCRFGGQEGENERETLGRHLCMVTKLIELTDEAKLQVTLEIG